MSTCIADGGWSCDLSPPVLMRAMVHVDNAYFIPHVEVIGRIAKTHLASNTAFRGFGGPQGMVVGEEIVDRVARHLGLPAHRGARAQFLSPGEEPDRNTTHYGQPVVDNHMPSCGQQLLQRQRVRSRAGEAAAFNAAHPHASAASRSRRSSSASRSTRPSTTRPARWCTSMPTAASS
jgi:xanthine dehydrogenase large subunit